MADRRDFFFKQRVTEDELDTAFDKLEQADWAVASDLGAFGIIDGLVAAQHDPVPDLTIDVSGPARVYDLTGRRIYVGTEQRVNVAVDENGVSTTVGTAGQERWIGVFIAFDRQLDDERVDGNGQAVYFVRDESFRIVVRQGAAAAIGAATRVALDDAMILICDVRRTNGVTAILDAEIDTSRRQAFVYTDATHIDLDAHVWGTLAGGSVQDAVEQIDSILTDLADQASATKGAADVGFAASGGTNAIGAGTARAAIIAVRDHLNDHEAAAEGAAHEASAINGLTTTAGTVAVTGDNLDDYLQTLHSYLYANFPRRIGTGTVNLAAGGSAVAINNLALEPTRVSVRAVELTGGVGGAPISTVVHNGQDPAGGGVEIALIDVTVDEDGAAWDVIVKNNTALDVRIYVEAYRVG